MHYITKGMGPACSPARLSIYLPSTLDPHCSPPARHPSPSSFLWLQLSFHPLLQFILSPPPLSPAHPLHPPTLPPSNCYRSDLAGSSLSLHPGCFLLCFCSGKCSKRDWERSVRASFSPTSHFFFLFSYSGHHHSQSLQHLSITLHHFIWFLQTFFFFAFIWGLLKYVMTVGRSYFKCVRI